MSTSVITYLLLSAIPLAALAAVHSFHERRKKSTFHVQGVIEYIAPKGNLTNVAEVKFEDEDLQSFQVRKSQWRSLRTFKAGDFVAIEIKLDSNILVSAKRQKISRFGPLLRLSETVFHNSTQ